MTYSKHSSRSTKEVEARLREAAGAKIEPGSGNLSFMVVDSGCGEPTILILR